MRTSIITGLILLCFPGVITAQKDSSNPAVYRVNAKYLLPASAVGVVLSTFGFREVEKLASMDAADVAKLNVNNINSFDRPIALLDPAQFPAAQQRSDVLLNVCLFTPLLLAFDKEIRKDWVDILSLYLASHALDNAVYFSAGFTVRRPRPMVYNPNVSLGEKVGGGKSSSFFSGHTSFSATAMFFMAKVYTDYHHIRGWERVLIYTVAAVPATLVGYYRMEAGKHFKTDVITGLAVGAAAGILVPEFHRIKKNKHPFVVKPWYDQGAGGLAFNIRL